MLILLKFTKLINSMAKTKKEEDTKKTRVAKLTAARVAAKKTKTTKKVKTESVSKPSTRKSIFYNLGTGVATLKSEIFEKKSKKTISIVLLVIGLGLLAFLASRYLVVAWVGNTPITRIQLYKELEKRYGKDTREQLIVQTLVEQEAKAKGISISQSEIDAEIQKIEKEQGGADKLNEILQLQNINRGDFRNLVRLQLLRQEMFGQGAEITDKELDQYIKDNKEQLPENMDQNLRETIRNNLKQQKINESFNKWLQETLESAKVKRV